VLGIGNAGANALDRIVIDGSGGLDLIAINTDAQILTGSVAPRKIQIGQRFTRGLGAGGDPEVGRSAAEEDISDVRAALAESNIAVLVVGLGGGTGSGAAPVIAEAARENGALVIVVATVPFAFEGKRRLSQAQESLELLRQHADILICFENDRVGDAVAPNAPIQEAFAEADRTIAQAVRALADFGGRKGLLHTGFDEVASAFRGANDRSVFGYGEASGDNRAHEALEGALRNPLLGRARLKDDVENVVVSVCGGADLTLNEVTILMNEFHRHVRENTRVFFGAAVHERMAGRLSVSILGSFESPTVAASSAPSVSVRKNRVSRPQSPVPEPVQPPLAYEYPEAEQEEAHAYESEEEQAYAEVESVHEEAEPLAEEHEPRVPETVVSSISRAVPPVRPPLARPPIGGHNVPPRPPREIRAEQMQLEPINRGRFEKSEPTIIDGQDLDVPTFLRRTLKP
jgi:cell division protein FtsZ